MHFTLFGGGNGNKKGGGDDEQKGEDKGGQGAGTYDHGDDIDVHIGKGEIEEEKNVT